MDERFLLIELLDDLKSSQNDNEHKYDTLLERCRNASELELTEFFDEISCSLDIYLPTLQAFISHLHNKYSQLTLRFFYQTKWNASLDIFASLLTTVIIMKNLHNSDIPGFGEFLHICIEFLWWAGSKDNTFKLTFQTIKSVFSAIVNANGALGILISGIHGHLCFKRILFDFNMIVQIEREELLKAVDEVVTLIEKCSEHKYVPSRLSEEFSTCKTCIVLLKNLRINKSMEKLSSVNTMPPSLNDMVVLENKKFRMEPLNRKRVFSNLHTTNLTLSIEDEQNLALLNMSKPRKPSELHQLLQVLEQKIIDLLQTLMEFLPCLDCHKQALVYFSPDKYVLEEEPTQLELIYRLPFELSNDDKLGPWDILLSEDTIKDLRQLVSSPSHDVIWVVKNKLMHISSGEWDKYKLRCDKDTKRTSIIPVHEINLTDDDGLKILWQVDYGFSIRSNSFTQLVKIWAVTDDKEQISKILENLSIIHQVYTSKSLCMVEDARDGVISPKNFKSEEEAKSSKNESHNIQVDDEKLLEIHRMLVTNKFVPLSKNLYKSLLLGGFNFTFQVSEKEYQIINSPASSIIIGRSGTGKTTCIVFRQIASYLNRQLCTNLPESNGFQKRQIFITVSPNLRHRVKEYFNKLLESATLSGKKMSLDDYRKMKEKEEEDNFFSMREEGDEDQDLDEIPNSFRELEDRHFPLFITYDKFAKMLQGTYGITDLITKRKFDAVDNIDSYDNEKGFNQKSPFIKTTNLVDYNVFRKKYWPSLGSNCNFDCELVYAEFSIIKGSDPNVDFLSREQYGAISTKKFPVFSYDRDRIYDLFKKYESMKSRKGQYDSIDRTLAILRRAKKKTLGGPHIHEVYIDECQDNQIVDMALILKVFDRVNNIFLAGDIAQCIARGSSFRFQDLNSLMYEWERTRAEARYSNTIVRPNQFELDVNYRSHNGILRLASSVIELIWDKFPNSIDRPSNEHSKVAGPLPIIFDGFQKEHFKIFSADKKESELDGADIPNDQKRVDDNGNSLIEFGAEQVIIVRDEEAKSNVKKLIDKAGLVMTVFESKGMEFNDVLLYNFFTDSPAGRKWRVILGTQEFSHEKHYILSSELKHLYVAVTRARQHIWICDENSEFIKPIRSYWKDRGLIKVTQSVDEIISTLAKKSSSDEWDQQGKNFFEQQNYEQAVFCFEKSRNKKYLELAQAYLLEQIAKDSDENTNFIIAAKAFIKCSRPKRAASCYQEINMHKEAGDVYIKWDMFEPAAHCYNKANMWDEAGKYFEKAKNYTDAVVAYKNANRYEKVIGLMQKHRQKIDSKIFNRIIRLVNIHYRRMNDKKMSRQALSILPTKEEQIKLLRDHAPEEFLEVCEKTGQFRAVAEDLCSHGEFEKAADKFNCSRNDEDLIDALRCLLHLCRVNMLKKTMMNVTNTSQELADLLTKASEIVQKIRSPSKRSDHWNRIMEEFRLYMAYLHKELDRVNKCIKFFKDHEMIANEVRAIIIWLQISSQPNIQTEYWSQRLQYLLRICDLTFPFIAPHQNISNVEIFEDIFFVNKVENCSQRRQIFSDNPLVQIINEIHDSNVIKDGIEIVDNRYVYDIHIVYQAISKFLASYIYELIWDANLKGRDIPNIYSKICYNFASYNSCSSQNCRKHHVVTTPSILHQRLELACLQYTVVLKLIVLYHCRLLKNDQSKEVRGLQRAWAEILVTNHIRYQSPRTSCPEVTKMVLAKLPYHTRNGFIELAQKIWLNEFDDASNFEVMLKCMFILQQLKNKWGINKFYWEMSKTKSPNYISIGYEYGYDNYYGSSQAIPVGKRLSSFYFHLYSNRVIDAIFNIRIFIHYAIKNSESVNLVKPDAFGDLISLLEFTTSLVFTISPGYCDFCLPRAYLVSYFEAFTANPLVSSYNCSREQYLDKIGESFDQIQQLLNLLIYTERIYFLPILRLLRLLTLIGLNESTYTQKVFNLFYYLNKKVLSKRIKKYLEEKSMSRLINVLCNDLKRTDCDSLVIVYHYNSEKLSRFSGLDKQGTVRLTYNSIEEFHSALQKIKSPIVTEENEISESQISLTRTEGKGGQSSRLTFASEQLAIPEEVQEPATEIQEWFRQIHDSPRAQEAAKKIQIWHRRVYKRIKSRRKPDYDPTLDNIYNDMVVFCQKITKEKGEKAASKYNILLRGQIVDVIVELIRLQGKMEVNKNKLKSTINNHRDTNKIDRCLELEDELKYNHYEKVEHSLKTLSVTENSSEHNKANVEWLEDELSQAYDIIEQVRKWINECKIATN